MPREAAEGLQGRFQDTCVRRRLRELSARGHRCACSRTELEYNRWRGRKASLVYAVAAVVLKHMQASLFLVFWPLHEITF
jgi:hypothetical protein